MNRQILLLGLALASGVGISNAQSKLVRKANVQHAVPRSGIAGDAYLYGSQPTPGAAPATAKSMSPGSYGTQIGHTYYDLMTNSASGNRIVRNSDGTISAVWNETCAGGGSPSFATRGPGYNYFNGTTWIHGAITGGFVGTCNEPGTADFGIASKRTGWPEIMVLSSGKEAVITHSNNGVNITSRPTKGTGGMAAWSATTDLVFSQNIQGSGNAGTWPRAVANGNNIHMIYAVNNPASTGANPLPVLNGVSNPMVYSRSVDGGLTWDRQNIFLPGMQGITAGNPATYTSESFSDIGGDDYAIAVQGNTVAIVAGSMGEPWTLWKSTDNGTTFTRRVIKAITAADTLIFNSGADTTAITNDGGHAIVIDNAGTVHVWAGTVLSKLITRTAPNGTKFFQATRTYFPNSTSGLLYWNDALPTGAAPTIVADIEDSQPAGPNDFIANGSAGGKRSPYGALGLTSMANAAYDAANNLYVVYAGAVEGTSNNGGPTGQPFRDLYILKRRSSDGAWSQPINIARTLNLFTTAPGSSTAENFEESVFPSVAHKIEADNLLHVMWMTDFEPGMNLGNDADPEGENAIMYQGFNVNTFNFVYTPVGIKKDIAAFVNEISAYPNPTNDKVNIHIDLKKNSNVTVRIMNLMGQEVANIATSQMAAGQNKVSVDMSKFANGVYLYTVTSDNFTVTNRIVKQ
jgi:hypothetical protein